MQSERSYTMNNQRNLVIQVNSSWSIEISRNHFKQIVDLLSEELRKDKKLELTKKLEELDKQRQQIVDELRDVS